MATSRVTSPTAKRRITDEMCSWAQTDCVHRSSPISVIAVGLQLFGDRLHPTSWPCSKVHCCNYSQLMPNSKKINTIQSPVSPVERRLLFYFYSSVSETWTKTSNLTLTSIKTSVWISYMLALTDVSSSYWLKTGWWSLPLRSQDDGHFRCNASKYERPTYTSNPTCSTGERSSTHTTISFPVTSTTHSSHLASKHKDNSDRVTSRWRQSPFIYSLWKCSAVKPVACSFKEKTIQESHSERTAVIPLNHLINALEPWIQHMDVILNV